MADEDKDQATAKGQRWPSAAERDLQRRLDEGADEKSRLSTLQGGAGQVSDSATPYAVEDNDTSNYVGVSPEYMTYADDRQKPLRAEEGPEATAEKNALQTTPVRDVAVKENNQTQGGGTTHETVYTATSGEDFTPDQTKNDGTPDGGTVTGGGTAVQSSAPTRKAAPAKPSGSSS